MANWKKVLATVLAVTTVAATVVGCGEKAVTPDTTTPADDTQEVVEEEVEVQDVALKVWAPEEDLEITQTMCDKFNELHPEYNITFEFAIVGVDESQDQLTTDPDVAADVFLVPSGGLGALVDAGLLYPITYDIDNVKALYGQGAVDACTKGDYLYGIPSTPNSWFMFYNKSMYTEDEIKSLDTMMAKDLGDVKNFGCALTNSWYIEAFFYGAGCTLYGADGTDPDDCTWNNADGVAAGEYLIDLMTNPDYVEDKDGIAGSMMKDQTLAAFCSGTWSADSIKEALGENYGACALPTFTLNGKECQLSNFADYKCYAVKSNTAYPLPAQLLAEYLGNEENQLIRYQTNNTTPTCVSLLDAAEMEDDYASKALLDQTNYATPQPSLGQISEYWTPAQALGEGIYNKEITKDNLKENLDTLVASVTSKLTD